MSDTIQGSVQGGKAMQRHLREIEKRLGRGAHVRVGFLASATYPAGENSEGLHVASVAFWNEFGTMHSPERPFFRDMVEKRSPRWGVALGAALRKTKYDAEKSLAIMGEIVKGQLVKSIIGWTTPRNAPSTIARKGFNKPLIDTGVMLRSVDYQVFNGADAVDD